MKIAIRKEPNGTIYIDKTAYTRTYEVKDEEGNITIQPMFTEEELSKEPYNYTKVEIGEGYLDCIGLDFNDDLTFSVDKYNARKQSITNGKRIAELKSLLANTDYQVLKWNEGELTDEQFEPMRLQRKAWREEIRSLGG